VGEQSTMSTDADAPSGNSPLSDPAAEEQGHRVRVEAPFPVIVRGIDAHGEAFESRTVLDHLSARSFSVRLAHRVLPDTRVFAVVRLATATATAGQGLRVAVRGVVRRAVRLPDGRYGVDVDFTRHRFL